MITEKQSERIVDKFKFIAQCLIRCDEIKKCLEHIEQMIRDGCKMDTILACIEHSKNRLESKKAMEESLCNSIISDVQGMVAGNAGKEKENAMPIRRKRNVRAVHKRKVVLRLPVARHKSYGRQRRERG